MINENIGIIPARGGSKGVKNKNTRLINGIPLLAYGIKCSLKAKSIDRTIVSTDDKHIAALAKKFGAQVIDRPSEYAKDESPTEDCMKHVVHELEKRNIKIKNIALVQATCPFRLSADIDDGFALLKKSEGDAVMSVSEIPSHFHPYWIKKINRDGYLSSVKRHKNVRNNILETKMYWRRQDLPGKYFWKNGALYIMTRDCLINDGHRYGNKCIPLVLDNSRLVNIDTEADIVIANNLLKNGELRLDFL